MKKLFLLAFIALSFVAAKSQSSVSVGSSVDEEGNVTFDEIYFFDEEVPFYIIVDDTKPITCNKMKVKAWMKDYISGAKEDEYYVYQGEFEFPIDGGYTGYWLEMFAYTPGEYKLEVNGYLNGSFYKYFGAAEFSVLDGYDDEWWF
jgi:hypothetical protein